MDEHLCRYWYFYYFSPVVWYFIIAGNVILGRSEGVSSLFALVSLAQLIIMGLVIPKFILQLMSKIEVLERTAKFYANWSGRGLLRGMGWEDSRYHDVIRLERDLPSMGDPSRDSRKSIRASLRRRRIGGKGIFLLEFPKLPAGL